MESHRIVSREQWTAARKELLAQEKELTRARDRLSAARRELPWVKVEKTYVFATPQGAKTLADLFEGRSQLIVQHFMWLTDQGQGCPGCSFLADHVDAANMHLKHHDVSIVAIARAPLAELDAYRRRMGWRFAFASSLGSDFNFDYHVSFTKEELASGKVYYNYQMTDASIGELPGTSVFYKDASGDIYHTYSDYARGGEEVLSAYMLLDTTPKGRNETRSMGWMRRHDEYEDAENRASCCAGPPANASQPISA